MAFRECIVLLVMFGVAELTEIKIADLVIHEVSERFLSFTIDDTVFYPSIRWGAFNLSSPRLLTLLSGLSPAIWRIGGSPADWLVFNIEQNKLNMSVAYERPPISMTKKDWDNLVKLSMKANLRLLFDLDLQLRLGSHWGLANTIELFDYCVSQGYGSNLDWELGNEPNVYHAPDQTPLTPGQIGDDFISLVHLVRSYPTFKNSSVVGPDVVGVTGDSAKIIRGYLEKAGQYVQAVTVHHYYFRGDTAHWTEYINPSHFHNLKQYLKTGMDIIHNSSFPRMALWLGETDDSWHSGTPNVSDRYVSGFLWLDKLGVSAQSGVDVVIRQTFWGHSYGMINDSMLPNPDYWLSLLYRRLVSRRVLNVVTGSSPKTTRVYAHCASNRYYKPGAVTLFMMNINTKASDKIIINQQFWDGKMDVYLMTPGNKDGLLSQEVSLNGHVLKMVDDHTLPELKPIQKDVTEGIILPPTTYMFVVLPSANLKVCH